MMNHTRRSFVLLALMLGLLFALPAVAGTLMAGAAVADITPDPAYQLPSSGYGQRKGTPMTGVHDPIKCKALALNDGQGQVAIVTCDMVMITPEFRGKVLAQLAGAGFDANNVLMAASHTHSGPGAMMNNFISNLAFGRYNDKYTQEAADRTAAAIQKAREGMKPATLRFSETRLEDLTRNRRDPAGSYNYDTRRFSSAYDPKNPRNDVDPTLTVLRVDGEDGKPIAILFHFPTHGTVMGADNLRFSADWMGAAMAKLEAAYPGAVALYLNGAQGDQAPTMLTDQRTDWEYVDYIGGKVADGVMSIMDKTVAVNASPIRSVLIRREIPAGDRVMGIWVGKAFVGHYFPDLALMGVRIGEVGLMACPVEMVSEVGRTMKEGARGQGVKYPLVVGLANEHMLYTASPYDFPDGGYEVENTVYGPTEAAILIGEELMIMNRLFAAE